MTSASIKSASGPARRTVVAAAGAAGLAVALTACGGSDDDSSSSSSSARAAGSTGSTAGTPAASTGGTGGGDNAPAGAALSKTSDIPEGGGKIFATEKVVVTQPTAGAVQGVLRDVHPPGCAVKSINDGVIHCPCHSSKFSSHGRQREERARAHAPARRARSRSSGDSITLA